MKAILCTRYGSPYDLELKEVRKPTPVKNEVLVKVHASSVNFNTLALIKGDPFIARLWTGISRPRYKIPGNDIAGCVEAVGEKVKQFKPGDNVFGDICNCGFGAFSEYVSVPETELVLKPANITFEEAAAIPEAGLVALQALRDKGKIKKDHDVLIYGASGGIGTFAVQIAKSLGAKVTGVCSTRNVEFVRSIGADHCIDYTREDFIRNGKKYDLIIATAGYRSIMDYRRALKPDGIYVATGGSTLQIFQALLLGPFISMFGRKKLCMLQVKPNVDLTLLKEFIENGKVKPVIDRSFPLKEACEAVWYYGRKRSRGKVAITMEHNN